MMSPNALVDELKGHTHLTYSTHSRTHSRAQGPKRTGAPSPEQKRLGLDSDISNRAAAAAARASKNAVGDTEC